MDEIEQPAVDVAKVAVPETVPPEVAKVSELPKVPEVEVTVRVAWLPLFIVKVAVLDVT